MKDLYELLNDVNLDESEFYEMEVNDIEKKKLKKNLRKSIKKKNNWKKKTISVATVLFVSTASLGIAFPSYAKSIPIVRDIFKALDTCKMGTYDNFKENSKEINTTKNSNGIQITLNEMVFSGESLTFTYTLKTDRDLGDYWTFCNEIALKGKEKKDDSIMSSSHFKKINKNTYICMQEVVFYDLVKNPKDKISFNLNVNAIYYHDRKSGESKPLEGDWNFEVNNLKAVKGKKQTINKSSKKDGVDITLNEISKYPMSTFIKYSQKVTDETNKKWKHVWTELNVKDDLGNVYQCLGNGGHGIGKTNNIDLSATFGNIKKEATKLIITPKVDFSNFEHIMSVDPNFKGKEMKHISFDEIIIDLKK